MANQSATSTRSKSPASIFLALVVVIFLSISFSVRSQAGKQAPQKLTMFTSEQGCEKICSDKKVDDAFIPPLMNESVAVIVKYPKYYVFDLAEGDVTDSGYVKDVWADISEAPTAVFSNVPMGYIIFYHRKSPSENIFTFYKVERKEDVFKKQRPVTIEYVEDTDYLFSPYPSPKMSDMGDVTAANLQGRFYGFGLLAIFGRFHHHWCNCYLNESSSGVRLTYFSCFNPESASVNEVYVPGTGMTEGIQAVAWEETSVDEKMYRALLVVNEKNEVRFNRDVIDADFKTKVKPLDELSVCVWPWWVFIGIGCSLIVLCGLGIFIFYLVDSKIPHSTMSIEENATVQEPTKTVVSPGGPKVKSPTEPKGTLRESTTRDSKQGGKD